MDDKEFSKALGDLVAYYRAHGCPCRFPRARAVLARDTHRVAGGSFSSVDRDWLIWHVEHGLNLADKRGAPYGWEARCADCGATVSKSANEFANGGWLEYLVIEPKPGVPDVGAPVGEHVYRCKPWWAPGPNMAGEAEASKAFPLIPVDEWFRWMRELAAAAPAP